ncbi:MAG TPA: hypothetical protein VE077_14410 [Candidatus Methylomirabilis sp.]|jgi:hypothetical protein|nr:hypothetical protein [Candidatus Limnocylindrales bacterium]HYL63808.1 hypothetical protein [Candidatus Methylomirabilis sp.]
MERTLKSAQSKDRGGAAKKRYVKPRCESEPIYETLALACGKHPGQSGMCHAAPRRS